MRPPSSLRLLRPMRFLVSGKSLSTCCVCCFLFSEAKEAVEVIEASDVIMSAEVIEATEVFRTTQILKINNILARITLF